jgi:hypothetical protein
MSHTRISSKPETFFYQLRILDNLQNSPGTPPHTKKYQDWFWTDEESAEVTKTREKAEELYTIIEAKSTCPPEIKVEMKLLIKGFMAYDHSKHNGHHLLDKIGLFGTITDWEMTGVRRGTSLAKTTAKRSDGISSSLTSPALSLRRIGMNEHLLSVRIPESPESRTTPDGIRSINIYCFIGTESPVNNHQYEYVGRSKRGLFYKYFSNIEPVENKRIYAWYIARYESTRGVLSAASAPLKVEIFLSTP